MFASKKRAAEYCRAYEVANRETIRERKKQYYRANRERVLELARIYRENNRDKKRDDDQKYYYGHLGQAREYARQNSKSKYAKARAARNFFRALVIAGSVK